MAYVTAAELRTWTGTDSTADNTFDTNVIIATVQALIEGPGPHGLNRKFEANASNRVFDVLSVDDGGPIDGSTLILDEDLASISSITNGDGTVVSSDDYVTVPRNAVADGEPIREIKLKTSAGISWTYTTDWEGAITVNGPWAYSATPPDNIKTATLMLCKWLMTHPEIAQIGLAGVSAVVMEQGFPKAVESILQGYRRL